MSSPDTVTEHYALPGLLARVEAGLGQMGKSSDTVSLDDLAPVDEFHFRAKAATLELIDLLDPKPGTRVLDAGSGLGGPARRLAATRDCTVTGIDLTGEYCAVGTTFNNWLRLADKVDLQEGDVTDLGRFEDASFDAAWTIHVGMNVENKDAFYGEVARVLKPGGRFVLFDILSADNGDVIYPAPWARDAKTSFLLTQAQLAEHLEDAGFEILETRDQTAEALNFIKQAMAAFVDAPAPPPLGLHLVLGPIFKEIAPNSLRNFAEGRLSVAALLCRRAL